MYRLLRIQFCIAPRHHKGEQKECWVHLRRDGFVSISCQNKGKKNKSAICAPTFVKDADIPSNSSTRAWKKKEEKKVSPSFLISLFLFIVISPIILSNSHYPSCFPDEQWGTANLLFPTPLWMMHYAKDSFPSRYLDAPKWEVVQYCTNINCLSISRDLVKVAKKYLVNIEIAELNLTHPLESSLINIVGNVSTTLLTPSRSFGFKWNTKFEGKFTALLNQSRFDMHFCDCKSKDGIQYEYNIKAAYLMRHFKIHSLRRGRKKKKEEIKQ